MDISGTVNKLSQNSHNSHSSLIECNQNFTNTGETSEILNKKLGDLEEQLQQYLFLNLQERPAVSKYFLVPTGLPGMGKTTL